ncbi:MAG: hypothetical protein AAF171_25005 [Cyanobacteria bacterium P01_A01_bin.116]
MLKISIAKTAQQIDEVLKMRHQVMANIQNPTVKASTLRLMDRFDTFPSTTHLVLMVRGNNRENVKLR